MVGFNYTNNYVPLLLTAIYLDVYEKREICMRVYLECLNSNSHMSTQKYSTGSVLLFVFDLRLPVTSYDITVYLCAVYMSFVTP